MTAMIFNKKALFASVLVVMLGLAMTQAHTASASALTTLSGRDLSVGSRGTDVADLQGILSEQGYLNVPVGVPFGYFGSLTQAALVRYQAAIGVPATGYFGPMTRAMMTEVFRVRGWLAILTRENG